MIRRLLTVVSTAALVVGLAAAPAEAVVVGATGCNTNVSTVLGSWDLDGDSALETVYDRHTGTFTEIGFVYLLDSGVCYGYEIPGASSYDWVLFSPPSDLNGIAGAELAVSWKTTPGTVLNQRKTWIVNHRTRTMSEVASGGNLSWDWQYDLDSLAGNDLLFTYQTLYQSQPDYGLVKVYSTQTGQLTSYSLQTQIVDPRFDQRAFGDTNGLAGTEAVFIQYPYISNSYYNGGFVKILDARSRVVRSYSTLPQASYWTSLWSLASYRYEVSQKNGTGGAEVTVYYQFYNNSTGRSDYLRWVVDDTQQRATLYYSW
ncbi:hypothetical protein ABGB16_27055 [Micromonospora sp. B11E3]|uniref:hypothetical protein n=1 Tax=Micromonospora sp. B11E3 TaxID=3153562 RepID=UPI00325E0FF9